MTRQFFCIVISSNLNIFLFKGSYHLRCGNKHTGFFFGFLFGFFVFCCPVLLITNHYCCCTVNVCTVLSERRPRVNSKWTKASLWLLVCITVIVLFILFYFCLIRFSTCCFGSFFYSISYMLVMGCFECFLSFLATKRTLSKERFYHRKVWRKNKFKWISAPSYLS